MNKKMRCDVDLDWVTYTCPCGHSICTRFMSDADVKAWKDQHKPHTDGTCLDHTTADGCRAWASPPPDQVYPL